MLFHYGVNTKASATDYTYYLQSLNILQIKRVGSFSF